MSQLETCLTQLEDAPTQIAMQRGILPCGFDGDAGRLWHQLDSQNKAMIGWIRRYRRDEHKRIPELLEADKGLAQILAKQSLAFLEIAQGAWDCDSYGVLQQGYHSAMHLWLCCELVQLESSLEQSGLLGEPKFNSKAANYDSARQAVKFLQGKLDQAQPDKLISEAEYQQCFGSRPGHIGRLLAIAVQAAQANASFDITFRSKLKEISKFQRLIERTKGLQIVRLDHSGKLVLSGVGQPPKRQKRIKGFVTKT